MGKGNKVVPSLPEASLEQKKERAYALALGAQFDEKKFRVEFPFKEGNVGDFKTVHTMPELMGCLEKDKKIEVEGVVIVADPKGNYGYKRIKNRAEFEEAVKSGNKLRKFREAKNCIGKMKEGFSGPGTNAGLVGDDYVPLLGGPFNKQPYLTDYLRAHAYCFHEYHHHPFARAIVHITRDFVLGRGYRVDSEDEKALALWRAFEKVNRLEELMEDIVKEGSTYGENMLWWLPNNEVYIAYQDRPGQAPGRGLIPRIRLIDPSTCWEIVTYPEDITRVLYYQLVFPTQYQIYTGSDGGQPVPGSKFIVQQIPASDIMHFKYNCMSNEKRGRSDLYPVLGYLKWIRDCVNYKLISLKKQAAWTEDVTVEGSQTDVDNLVNALKQLGEFEPAGSRFVHTDKVKREYKANSGTGGTDDPTLDWGVNMICAGSTIPYNYFGLKGSHGQTRAGAVVATEPVAKKFERRQQEVARILKAIWRKFQDEYGVKDSECDVIFPEIITQDRSAKLKDIKFAEDSGYISRRTAAPMAAKELDVEKYDYDEEKAQIDEETPDIHPIQTITNPLTAPATGGAAPGGGQPPAQDGGKPQGKDPTPRAVSTALGRSPVSPGGSPSAVTSQDRRDVKQQDRNGAAK